MYNIYIPWLKLLILFTFYSLIMSSYSRFFLLWNTFFLSQTFFISSKFLDPWWVQKQAPRCSVRKGVLRNLTKFTWKLLCQSFFFNKVAGLRSSTLSKKETLAQVFSCEFYKISRNTSFTETSEWLLLWRMHLRKA